jgi:hypothetical protein
MSSSYSRKGTPHQSSPFSPSSPSQIFPMASASSTITQENPDCKGSSDCCRNTNEIKKVAYNIAQEDGFQFGKEQEYWLQAEAQVQSVAKW